MNLTHINHGGWDVRKGLAPITIASQIKVTHALKDAIPLHKLLLPIPKLALCDATRPLAIEDASPAPLQASPDDAQDAASSPGTTLQTFSGAGLNPLFMLANEKMHATKMLKRGRKLSVPEVNECFRHASEEYSAFSAEAHERQLERYRYEVALRRAYGPMLDKRTGAIKEVNFEPQFGRGGTYSAPISAAEVIAAKAETPIPKLHELDDAEFTIYAAAAAEVRSRLRGHCLHPHTPQTHHLPSDHPSFMPANLNPKDAVGVYGLMCRGQSQVASPFGC
jgi:hypothetical protein